ncbi:hypothetical protein [Lysobacter capsici]|nr:hypothetical protein [Lysobacter capsici]UJB21480.1 hypothetical protein L1A79_10690 [Lysobacter capsici]
MSMATDADIDEIKRMCAVVFCELQDIRRRLDIEPAGGRDEEACRETMEASLKLLDRRMQSLAKDRSGYDL